MDQGALTALQGSIEKWEKIVLGEGADEGTSNCPLCLRYHADYNDFKSPRTMCSPRCPVKAKTGKPACQGTPYLQWVTAYREEHIERTGERGSFEYAQVIGPKTQAAAIAEYDFLVSLLPEE